MRIAVALLTLVWLPCASAGWDAARVQDWFASLDSFQAQFTQRVVDSDGVLVQSSEGEVWIKRPGRFRWNYRKPFEQQVVADGKRLWTYDPDLEQATVKSIDEVLSVTPAVLLSGLKPFREMVAVEPLDSGDGGAAFRLQPRESGDEVRGLEVTFLGDRLVSIRLHDSFGNTTEIRFSESRVNGPVADALFSMELPAGTDILGAE